MAKYELGAIYKINGRSGELYYVRLLTNDCYGVFSSSLIPQHFDLTLFISS